MTWTLSITHIDVAGPGDATLIVATDDGVGAGHVAQTRSALIDGGLLAANLRVQQVLIAAGVNPLDVIAATHYDRDHYFGLRALLATGIGRYAATRVYDQGFPGTVEASVTKRQRGPDGRRIALAVADLGAVEDDYRRYATTVGGRVRPTATVCSSQDAPPELAAWHDPHWLIGTDILWDGVAGGRPNGAPQLECVAANQYVYTGHGAVTLCQRSATADPERQKNAKSLGFLLTFGNFKYYVAGDLESEQEDQLATYLNQTDDDNGRVHAFKTSHHGSQYSSSQAFLARLRPLAAFVSCSSDNKYHHPDQPVVNDLEQSSAHYYFLTGEDMRGGAQLTNKAAPAGVWPPGSATLKWGDIRLEATEAEANAVPVGFRVIYDQADAGANVNKDLHFAYLPYSTYTVTYA